MTKKDSICTGCGLHIENGVSFGMSYVHPQETIFLREEFWCRSCTTRYRKQKRRENEPTLLERLSDWLRREIKL